MKEYGTVRDMYEFKLNLFHITDVVDINSCVSKDVE